MSFALGLRRSSAAPVRSSTDPAELIEKAKQKKREKEQDRAATSDMERLTKDNGCKNSLCRQFPMELFAAYEENSELRDRADELIEICKSETEVLDILTQEYDKLADKQQSLLRSLAQIDVDVSKVQQKITEKKEEQKRLDQQILEANEMIRSLRNRKQAVAKQGGVDDAASTTFKLKPKQRRKHNGHYGLYEGKLQWSCCLADREDAKGCIDDNSVGIASTLCHIKSPFDNFVKIQPITATYRDPEKHTLLRYAFGSTEKLAPAEGEARDESHDEQHVHIHHVTTNTSGLNQSRPHQQSQHSLDTRYIQPGRIRPNTASSLSQPSLFTVAKNYENKSTQNNAGIPRRRPQTASAKLSSAVKSFSESVPSSSSNLVQNQVSTPLDTSVLPTTTRRQRPLTASSFISVGRSSTVIGQPTQYWPAIPLDESMGNSSSQLLPRSTLNVLTSQQQFQSLPVQSSTYGSHTFGSGARHESHHHHDSHHHHHRGHHGHHHKHHHHHHHKHHHHHHHHKHHRHEGPPADNVLPANTILSSFRDHGVGKVRVVQALERKNNLAFSLTKDIESSTLDDKTGSAKLVHRNRPMSSPAGFVLYNITGSDRHSHR